MTSEPDNLTLLQLRFIREQLSDMKRELGSLGARVGEIDERGAADAKTRLRHEAHIAELEVKVGRIETRLELRDGD